MISNGYILKTLSWGVSEVGPAWISLKLDRALCLCRAHSHLDIPDRSAADNNSLTMSERNRLACQSTLKWTCKPHWPMWNCGCYYFCAFEQPFLSILAKTMLTTENQRIIWRSVWPQYWDNLPTWKHTSTPAKGGTVQQLTEIYVSRFETWIA